MGQTARDTIDETQSTHCQQPRPRRGQDIHNEARLNRVGTVAPDELPGGGVDTETFTDPETSYNAIEVRGTYIGGAFIDSQSGPSSFSLYHVPRRVELDEDARYVGLYDFRHGLRVAVTVERFKDLLTSDALWVVDAGGDA